MLVTEGNNHIRAELSPPILGFEPKNYQIRSEILTNYTAILVSKSANAGHSGRAVCGLLHQV
jgi:hypothetical protein